ncbi:MAG: histidinol-phosphate transaminase, partial [Syntrophomonadaceae bacterium]|nr:histidinol-phosphate transaminase [Syntrophomonadaceae bacterium]
ITDVIKLASNENPLGPSALAKAAVAAVLAEMHMYPDGSCFRLRNALAAHYGIKPSCFMLGNGSDELLKILAETFLDPGDEVIIAAPTFSEYEFVAKIMGAVTVKIPLKAFRHDLPAMAAAITPATKMIIICNPNNPTGSVVSRQETEEFMARVPDDVLVVFDEAYGEYVTSPAYASGLEWVMKGRNAVVLHTFSKLYGLAALRIGYGMSNEAIVAAADRVTEPFNVNMPAQIAAEAALADVEHRENSRRVNEEGKAYLYKNFAAMGLDYVPTEANFIFVDLGMDCQAAFKALLRRGVIVRTGDVFGYPRHIRVTVGTAEENERFIRNLQRLNEA